MTAHNFQDQMIISKLILNRFNKIIYLLNLINMEKNIYFINKTIFRINHISKTRIVIFLAEIEKEK